mgnify:CR=1 FL=1
MGLRRNRHASHLTTDCYLRLKHHLSFVLPMVGRRAVLATAIALLFLIPLASSTIIAEREPGGFDADGNWIASVEHDVHPNWWLHWSRDKDGNELDDRLEWLLEQPAEMQQDWWKRAPPGSARIFVDYDHHPTDADVSALEDLGVEVTFRFTYVFERFQKVF